MDETTGMPNRQGSLACVLGALCFCILLLAGCASVPPASVDPTGLQVVTASPQQQFRNPPLFLLFGADRRHNRIGTVQAVHKNGEVQVVVNGQEPTLYTAVREFSTARATYTNYVYRIHFEATPHSLFPFHLTAGKHPGLLVIITLNQSMQPLLVTTVHTCGCYAAVVPTGWLDEAVFPDDWPKETQSVYGEKLPARLAKIFSDQQFEILVRPDLHRVMDVRVRAGDAFADAEAVVAPEVPLESLRHLPLPGGGETSFYYGNWPLQGHVKGAVKWWEMLLLSVPSLDLLVGMDKDYGDTELTGNPFYTSLQPWYRHSSDLNDFVGFLHFHGWKL
ncbi:hypothetical protein [Desulfogranum marinum]|jgi:hypothetical protein|uniref:hypothetical protein n=1 Tax=Desulfogranum marinum TaxID=453220 RepID=UPI0029C85AB5|nr:hypothetical protein [Desulfogranum marinum]